MVVGSTKTAMNYILTIRIDTSAATAHQSTKRAYNLTTKLEMSTSKAISKANIRPKDSPGHVLTQPSRLIINKKGMKESLEQQFHMLTLNFKVIH